MIRALALGVLVMLAGCQPPVQPHLAYPPASPASLDCFSSGTAATGAICRNPALAAAERDMAERYAARLGDSDLFERDRLSAAQTAWFLGIFQACPGLLEQCLSAAIARRRDALAALEGNPAWFGEGRLLTSPALVLSRDEGFCPAARQALSEAGAGDPLDPARLPQAVLVAGLHGAPRGEAGGHAVEVETSRAGEAGAFSPRADRLLVDGREVLGTASLGDLVRRQANEGGRPGSFAATTGGAGTMDAIAWHGQLLGFVADPLGEAAPNGAGEFAYAAWWTLEGGAARPLCLIELWRIPAPDALDRFAALAAWRQALEAWRGTPPDALDGALTRTASALRGIAEWTVLNAPLQARAVAKAGWTGWLRARHDAILDALEADPSAGAVIGGMKAAAADLVAAYEQVDGLDAAEAREAAGVAVMELLYGATVYRMPGLDPGPPARFAAYAARHGIIGR